MTATDNRQPDPIDDLPFPLEAFPPAVAAWLEASANQARVPLAMVAVPFLAFTGAWLGERAQTEVSPGWTERPVLWVALVAPTGHGKTPALQAARAPFVALHDEHWQAWYDWDRQHWTVSRGKRPPLDPLFAATANREALTRLYRRSYGLCIYRDELASLVRGIDGRGEDRQFLLSLWSSEQILAPDPEAVPINIPVIGIVGGLQPRMLPRLRGSEQDGLLERFLLVCPEASLDRWRDPGRDAPDTASIVELLRPLRRGDDLVVACSGGASLAWQGWFNRNVDEHDHAGPTLAGFYRKLPGQLARIALILHALWHPDDLATPLEEATMRHAIDLVEFLRVHQRRAAALIGERGHGPSRAAALAERLLGILVVESDWVSRTGLQQRLGRPETSLFDLAIAHLVDQGTIEVSKHQVTGSRKHVTHYRHVRSGAPPVGSDHVSTHSAPIATPGNDPAVTPETEMTLEQAVLATLGMTNADSIEKCG